MAKYDEVIAGTDIEKNPELPAPKKIVAHSPSDIESGQVEVPLTGGVAVPSTKPVTPPKPKIKRAMSIRETDNGYLVYVDAGDFHEEWVFTKLSKVVKTLTAYFRAIMEE